jgi:hypothetical protein
MKWETTEYLPYRQAMNLIEDFTGPPIGNNLTSGYVPGAMSAMWRWVTVCNCSYGEDVFELQAIMPDGMYAFGRDRFSRVISVDCGAINVNNGNRETTSDTTNSGLTTDLALTTGQPEGSSTVSESTTDQVTGAAGLVNAPARDLVWRLADGESTRAYCDNVSPIGSKCVSGDYFASGMDYMRDANVANLCYRLEQGLYDGALFKSPGEIYYNPEVVAQSGPTRYSKKKSVSKQGRVLGEMTKFTMDARACGQNSRRNWCYGQANSSVTTYLSIWNKDTQGWDFMAPCSEFGEPDNMPDVCDCPAYGVCMREDGIIKVMTIIPPSLGVGLKKTDVEVLRWYMGNCYGGFKYLDSPYGIEPLDSSTLQMITNFGTVPYFYNAVMDDLICANGFASTRTVQLYTYTLDNVEICNDGGVLKICSALSVSVLENDLNLGVFSMKLGKKKEGTTMIDVQTKRAVMKIAGQTVERDSCVNEKEVWKRTWCRESGTTENKVLYAVMFWVLLSLRTLVNWIIFSSSLYSEKGKRTWIKLKIRTFLFIYKRDTEWMDEDHFKESVKRGREVHTKTTEELQAILNHLIRTVGKRHSSWYQVVYLMDLYMNILYYFLVLIATCAVPFALVIWVFYEVYCKLTKKSQKQLKAMADESYNTGKRLMTHQEFDKWAVQESNEEKISVVRSLILPEDMKTEKGYKKAFHTRMKTNQSVRHRGTAIAMMFFFIVRASGLYPDTSVRSTSISFVTSCSEGVCVSELYQEVQMVVSDYTQVIDLFDGVSGEAVGSISLTLSDAGRQYGAIYGGSLMSTEYIDEACYWTTLQCSACNSLPSLELQTGNC